MYRVISETRIIETNDREEATRLYMSLSLLKIPCILVAKDSVLASVGKDNKEVLVKLINQI